MKALTPAKVTVLMLVAVGGLVTAYLAKELLAGGDAEPEIRSRMIPMAVADLEPGTFITEAHLGQGPVPEDVLLQTPDVLINDRVVVGRVVKERIPAATPIRSFQLYQPGQRPPLKVSGKRRAYTISVGNSTDMVNGRIDPGQYVDVHLTPDAGDDPRFRGGLTLTLFEGVRVLAVHSLGDQLAGGDNSVTLELTPEQVNVAILAGKRGDLTLSYNPAGPGRSVLGTRGNERATLEEILGLRPLPAAKPFEAEMFRGSSRGTVRFQDGRRVGSTGDAGNALPARPIGAGDIPGTAPEPSATGATAADVPLGPSA